MSSLDPTVSPTPPLSMHPSNSLPTPLDSARSSLTYIDPNPFRLSTVSDASARKAKGPPTHSLDPEQYEDRIERYGGDDVREPGDTESTAEDGKPKPVFVTWDGPDDPANPQNWSPAYKWFVTAVCQLMTVNVTFASSAPTSATLLLMHEFNISQTVASLLTTTFLLGYVFGPLLWGPGSEVVGRRPIAVWTLTFYTIFHLGQALAPTPNGVATLLITRFFSGFFAVGPLTICGGIIADIWNAENRGLATSMFTASVFLGPVLGPLVGGFVVSSGLKWNWIFWIMMIFAAVCTIVAWVWMPETYAPVLLLKKAKRLRKEGAQNGKETSQIKAEHEDADWSFNGLVHRTVYRPFKMLAMEPILVLITAYLSVVYGVLYASFQSLPLIFLQKHKFTLWQSGLIFIGVGIGSTAGAVLNYLLSRHYPALIKQYRGFPPPEQRLTVAMVGAPMLVIGSFWLGWTGNYENVHWIVPAIGTVWLGLGISMIFMGFLSYIVDTYLMYSASAFAANTIIRSLVAAVFPLFTVQMYKALGINWASTLIGLVALLFVPSPFLFYKYGPKIRERSRFAPCVDLQISKELALEKEKEALEGTKEQV